MILSDESFKQVMRRWPTGVSIVTSVFNGVIHGMTVNSFTSVAVHPPMVAVTLANTTRTFRLVAQSGIFGVTFLSESQADLSDRFAGRLPEESDRFAGVDWFTLSTGAPFLAGGVGYLDCQVVYTHAMTESTLLIGEVVATRVGADGFPLVYLNRSYHRLER